jgi:hypothetical protein
MFSIAAAGDLPIVHGQPSFVLENASIQVSVTKVGGHLIAAFDRASPAPIRPYHVSPWQEEGAEDRAADPVRTARRFFLHAVRRQ